MKKTLLILLLSFGLSSCLTTEGIKSVSKNISNNFSTKKVNSSTNEVKEDNNQIKFTQWKCYENDWKNKFQNHLLTIGYFPELEELENNLKYGMLILKDTPSELLTFYSLKGVEHNWNWSLSRDKNFMDYTIRINSQGTGLYYDFEGAKQNEIRKHKQIYDCKPPETILVGDEVLNGFLRKTLILSQTEIDNIRNHIGKCWKLHIKNIKKIDLDTIVSLKISTRSDGVVKEISIVDIEKYNSNKLYRLVADSARRSVLDCSPLPIPKDKSELFKSFIFDFDPTFVFEN